MSGRTAGRIAAISVVSLSGVAVAQSAAFRDVTDSHLPAGLAGPCMDAAAGDADGDGDLDIALAMEFERNVLLLNDGRGRFDNASERLPNTVHDSEDVAFADFDGDGDLDLILVSEDDRTDEFYLNDGRGSFSDASERLPPGDTSNALAVVDLDGDGLPDVLIGNVGRNRVLISDGQGGFRDETEQRWPQSADSRTQDLEVADVDGDGDLDLLVANEGQNQLYLMDGGRLHDATRGRLPQDARESREIRTADVDGDGDLDAIVANVDFLLGESTRDVLLLNDGTGSFIASEAERFPEDARSNFTVQTVDLDDDGDLDVLAPSTVFPRAGATPPTGGVAGDYLVLVNDGSGAYAVAPPGELLPSTANGNGFDIEVADFDGDGRTDLFLCNRGSQRGPEAAALTGGLPRLLLRGASSTTAD